MSNGYEDLDVYNRSFSLALKVYKFSQTLPKIEQYAMADQIKRASTSICANIAEGHAKAHFSKAEFKRFLTISAGSSQKMKVWLKFCYELDYLDEKLWQQWDDEYNQITRMLNGLIRKISPTPH